MGSYGIVVLSFFRFFFFLSDISVILILKYGTAVSFSHEVYSFSPFWLTVFGKRRPFTVLYCSLYFSV